MAKCPICKTQDVDPRYRPFCSRRCGDIDLQRWFSGAYAIPGEPVEGEAESPSRSPSREDGED